VFINLSPYFAKDNLQSQLRDIPAVVVNRFSRNGQLYGIPDYLHMRAVGINRQYREQSGLAVPSNNWSWDEYRAYAKKLTQKNSDGSVKVWGTTIAPYWSTVQGWLRGNGAKLTAPGDRSVIDLIKPEVIETFEFLANVRKEHTAYIAMSPGILGGKVAMQESMASNYAKNMDESIYDFDTVEHPLSPKGGRAIVVNDGSLYISKNSTHKDAAC
jgi:multiple sugar transport system substrate-binding protein